MLYIDDVFQYCKIQNMMHNCCVNKENVKYCQVPLSEIWISKKSYFTEAFSDLSFASYWKFIIIGNGAESAINGN